MCQNASIASYLKILPSNLLTIYLSLFKARPQMGPNPVRSALKNGPLWAFVPSACLIKQFGPCKKLIENPVLGHTLYKYNVLHLKKEKNQL